eukprot:TRINITY_DN2016_c0_g2_i2.p1 TRINITY_DN2016_c0_g2~~TRINITY_DN2016_c0_g2_i2.p1  ORF type:complete len:298 (-),score=-8.29 TRINITY_DN2016_c0_g2_i2:110-1003(-)
MTSLRPGCLLLACLLLALAGSWPCPVRHVDAYGSVDVNITIPGTNYTIPYHGPNTTDILIGILNGTIPIGRIESLLFTQINRFNAYVANSAASTKGIRTSRFNWKKMKPPKIIPQPNFKVAAGPSSMFISQGSTVTKRTSNSYDIQCDDDDDDEEDEDSSDNPQEPIGRVRVQMYTSVNNITFARFRVKSKWVPDVRTVQIRKAPYGKIGRLVMTIPGSWRLTKSSKFRLSFQTLIVNSSYAKTDTGYNVTKVVADITKEPWNYYAMLTSKSAPDGILRGQLWKPYCPWCNSTWWGL